MITRSATVRNAYGIHVRPSSVIALAARQFQSTLTVRNEKGTKVDAKNLLGIISLGVTLGQEVTIAADGEDEADAIARLVELFETNFDFPR
ncbi:MAG: HPr family phosphocarrier protein [Lentisphaeria bacterium]|jgi:phosphocarrier protein